MQVLVGTGIKTRQLQAQLHLQPKFLLTNSNNLTFFFFFPFELHQIAHIYILFPFHISIASKCKLYITSQFSFKVTI